MKQTKHTTKHQLTPAELAEVRRLSGEGMPLWKAIIEAVPAASEDPNWVIADVDGSTSSQPKEGLAIQFFEMVEVSEVE